MIDRRAGGVAGLALTVGLCLLASLLPSSAESAENYGLGIRGGVATSLSGGFDSSAIDDRLLEAQFHVEVEDGVLLRLRGTHFELKGREAGEPDARLDRLGVDIEYQFQLPYYTSGVFVGGGYYRFSSGSSDELPNWADGKDHFSYYGGLNALFEVSPGLVVVPELAVERFSNKKPRTIGIFSLGLVYKF